MTTKPFPTVEQFSHKLNESFDCYKLHINSVCPKTELIDDYTALYEFHQRLEQENNAYEEIDRTGYITHYKEKYERLTSLVSRARMFAAYFHTKKGLVDDRKCLNEKMCGACNWLRDAEEVE